MLKLILGSDLNCSHHFINLRRIARLLIPGLAFLTPLSQAKYFSEFTDSFESPYFTAEEKKYFTDATDRFVKYEISKDFQPRSIVRWLDNDHIAFSAKKLPGWEVKRGEASRIIALNVTNNHFSDIGYRGNLQCLNFRGEMIVRLGGDEDTIQRSASDYKWLAGKWGKDLSEIESKPSSFIPRYRCEFFPMGDQIFTTNPEQLPKNAHRKLPLLPEHGYLKETVAKNGSDVTHPVDLVRPDGSSQRVTEHLPTRLFFDYLPWLDAYFEIGTSERDPPRILTASGSFRDIHPPLLIRFWLSQNTGVSVGGILTKAGMLWDVHQGSGYWRKQGLYLETSEGLLRIEEGRGGLR